jgi:hypothetical protein
VEQQSTLGLQAQVEAAVKETLLGWGGELDDGRKFWWGDWQRLINDVITAIRTGTAVTYDEDEPVAEIGEPEAD